MSFEAVAMFFLKKWCEILKTPYGSKDPLLGMHLGYNLGSKVSS